MRCWHRSRSATSHGRGRTLPRSRARSPRRPTIGPPLRWLTYGGRHSARPPWHRVEVAPHLHAPGVTTMRVARRLALIPVSLLIAVGCRAPSSAAASLAPRPESLQAYTSCAYSGGLDLRVLTRSPLVSDRELGYRAVATADGLRPVSVQDGYQIVLGFAVPSYFANVRVERSARSKYAADKRHVLESLDYMKKLALVTVPRQYEHR